MRICKTFFFFFEVKVWNNKKIDELQYGKFERE